MSGARAAIVVLGSLIGTSGRLAAQDGWLPTGSLNVARFEHTATLLPNGKVLVAGGGDGLSSAELYDPVAGTWTPTGSLNGGRTRHSATLLPNGKVLVVGGLAAGGGGLSRLRRVVRARHRNLDADGLSRRGAHRAYGHAAPER